MCSECNELLKLRNIRWLYAFNKRLLWIIYILQKKKNPQKPLKQITPWKPEGNVFGKQELNYHLIVHIRVFLIIVEQSDLVVLQWHYILHRSREDSRTPERKWRKSKGAQRKVRRNGGRSGGECNSKRCLTEITSEWSNIQSIQYRNRGK